MLKNYRDLEQFPPTKLDMKHIIIVIILSLTIFTVNADAHRLQPAYLEINEQSAGIQHLMEKTNGRQQT